MPAFSEALDPSSVPQAPPLTAPWPSTGISCRVSLSANCHQLDQAAFPRAVGCLLAKASFGRPIHWEIGIASSSERWGDIPARPGGGMRWGGRPRKREMGSGSGRDQKTLLYGPYPQSSDSQQRQAPFPPSHTPGIWRCLEAFLVVTTTGGRGVLLVFNV